MIAAELGRLSTNRRVTSGRRRCGGGAVAKVTRERLEWQLHRFAEGGIYNLVVINLAPAGPTFGAMPDDPAWFSEEWWDRFGDACRIARQLDLKIWFYDQIGFSGANIQGRITLDHPEVAGQSLRRSTVRAGSAGSRCAAPTLCSPATTMPGAGSTPGPTGPWPRRTGPS